MVCRNSILSPAGVFALAVTVGASACGPSQEELDAERAKARALQENLRAAQSHREELEGRLQQLGTSNQTMRERLRALGEDVEELEGERAGLQSSLNETQRALEELRQRERLAQARLQTFRKMLEQLRSLIDAGQLTVTVRHGRMVVVLPEGVLFDSGKARLKSGGEATLTQVGQVLAGIENRQFQVTGHTDNVPIRSRRFPSNWELSAARAINVTRFLIDQGLPNQRLSAAGYADTQPVSSNDTPEGQALNRRIEIAVVFNVEELPDLSALDAS